MSTKHLMMRTIQVGTVNNRIGPYTVGRTDGTFRVVERRPGDVWIEIHPRNGSTIRVPDCEASIDGLDYRLVDNPEDTPRDVYLSPGRQNLFIGKHLDSTAEVGNVYRRYGPSARMIRVEGLRFDEACVRYYCANRRVPLHSVTGGGRAIFLISWHGENRAVFDIGSSNFGFKDRPGARSVFFHVVFDFARARFVHLEDIKRFRY